MQLDIGTILGFVMFLFVLNGLAIGFGLVSESWNMKYNPLGTDVNYSNIEDKYYNGGLGVVGANTESEGIATTNPSDITGVPYTKELTGGFGTFRQLVIGFMFGWASFLMLLPIGAVMYYILVGLVGLLQLGALIYLVSYIVSIIGGGGGI